MLKILFLFCVVFSYESYAGSCEEAFAESTNTEQNKDLDHLKHQIEETLKRPLTPQQWKVLTSSDSMLETYTQDKKYDHYLYYQYIVPLLEVGFRVTELETLFRNKNLHPEYGHKKVEVLYTFMSLVDIMQNRLGQKKPMSTQQMHLIERIVLERQMVNLIPKLSVFMYENLLDIVQKMVEISGSSTEFSEVLRGKNPDVITFKKGGKHDRRWRRYIKNRNQAEKQMGKALTTPTIMSLKEAITKHNNESSPITILFGTTTLQEAINHSGLTSEDLRILTDNNVITTSELKKAQLRRHIEDYFENN